jgi:hypothetical protein
VAAFVERFYKPELDAALKSAAAGPIGQLLHRYQNTLAGFN